MSVVDTLQTSPKPIKFKELLPGCGFIIHSPKMQYLALQIRQFAPTNASVLICGETGTGKELIAQSIHKLSDRHRKALTIIDCTNLTDSLINSELFGDEKGSFTGAIGKAGLFEASDKGTVFIDEVSELPFEHQSKLLRILENGTIRRVGGTTHKSFDIRVIVATNRLLDELVRLKKFRLDLYYRLKGLEIKVPALRHRPEDIPILAEYYLRKFAEEFNKPTVSLSAQAINQLEKHNWRGNVRELRNTIRTTVLISQSDTIENIEFFEEPDLHDEDINFDVLTLEQAEKVMIERALKRNMGVQKDAARDLGITARVMNYKLGTLEVDWKRYGGLKTEYASTRNGSNGRESTEDVADSIVRMT